jgi:hypothetical protein
MLERTPSAKSVLEKASDLCSDKVRQTNRILYLFQIISVGK